MMYGTLKLVLLCTRTSEFIDSIRKALGALSGVRGGYFLLSLTAHGYSLLVATC